MLSGFGQSLRQIEERLRLNTSHTLGHERNTIELDDIIERKAPPQTAKARGKTACSPLPYFSTKSDCTPRQMPAPIPRNVAAPVGV